MFQPQGIVCKDINEVLDNITTYEVKVKREYAGNRSYKNIKYINLPCSFDIETSSFEVNGYKASCLYIWQFGINGYVCYGRTWSEFETAMKLVVDRFNLNENKRLPIYVHNLGYEFQFIRYHFNFSTERAVFAKEKREPLRAMTSDGLEFRCSLALSGCSLEQTAKDLTKYKVAKKVGDLDYTKIRTPLTKLTKKELDYCIYDVICVMNYIKEEMEKVGDDVTRIPMTKTGKVRERFRERCFNTANRTKYCQLMKTLTINDLNEYEMLKWAFAGGYTHGSFYNGSMVCENVHSDDFTSAYPFCMVAFRYPMGKGEYIDVNGVDDIHRLESDFCLIFNVHIKGLRPKFKYEHYLSSSKCWTYDSDGQAVPIEDTSLRRKLSESQKTYIDNGRIIKCPELFTTITNVDLEIMEKDYEWDSIEIGKCIRYPAAYLPTPFVDVVLELYEKKTTLKDVPGMEAEYMMDKGDLNSSYGCTVQDITNDLVTYDDDWGEEQTDYADQIGHYNKAKRRFLFYPWGVFVTAYCRRNLWTAIFEMAEDYVYVDTDSIKYMNRDKHRDYVKRYNEWCIQCLENACRYHGFDISRVKPKTVKGKEKPLGVWDDDGDYRRFKTLGAKRYLVEYFNKDDNNWHLKCTIAGVNKKLTSKWFEEHYDNAFELFSNEMTVPEDYSGRLISTYLDREDIFDCDVTDYQGNRYHVTKNTGIHLSKSEYNLTMSPIYMLLLSGREKFVAC